MQCRTTTIVLIPRKACSSYFASDGACELSVKRTAISDDSMQTAVSNNSNTTTTDSINNVGVVKLNIKLYDTNTRTRAYTRRTATQ